MSDDLAQRMRTEWNERATLDPYHHVLNRKGIGEWNPADFYATGGENWRLFVAPFCAAQEIDPTGMTCLEIGCGAGRETVFLARQFANVIALDVSDAMIEQARQHVTADNVRFVRGSGVNLDVVENVSVDFVYSFIVFQHIPDPEIQYAYLRDVARVLKPGGWFMIHLYGDEDGYAVRLAKWRERVEAHDLRGWSEAAWRELENNRFETSMQTAVNGNKTLAVLSEAGLEVVLNQNPGTAVWLLGGYKA